MRRFLPFLITAVLIVGSGTVLAWPFLGGPARSSLLLAGALVLITQVGLHLALAGWKSRDDKLLAAIITGFASRAALVGVALIVFVLPGRVEPVPFLLAIAGFLVTTLLAESVLDHRTLVGKGGAAHT